MANSDQNRDVFPDDVSIDDDTSVISVSSPHLRLPHSVHHHDHTLLPLLSPYRIALGAAQEPQANARWVNCNRLGVSRPSVAK